MNFGMAVTRMRETTSVVENTIGKAFLTAQLLTASAAQAESAVTAALDGWDAEGDGEDALFHRVVNEAVRNGDPDSLPRDLQPDQSESLPPELEAVLKLAPRIRQCFVLRILVGLSPQACARLLRLDSQQVDEHACSALERLPSLGEHRVADDRASNAY